MSTFRPSSSAGAFADAHNMKYQSDYDAKASGRQQKLSFMGKLVHMLSESDPSIVRWTDSGASFLVLDCKR